MKLEQAHSQPPFNPSDSTAAINAHEHAPNAGSGHAIAETVTKNDPSAVAATSKTTSTAAAPVDYGRKLFEIDNVCFPHRSQPCCSFTCAGAFQNSVG
jgi:hypothetical protein